MKNLNNLSRILLYFTSISGILWLGSYTARLFVSYYLFESDDFILKNYINGQNISGIFITLTPAYIITLVLYSVFILSFYLLIITSGMNLKTNGWLFIIIVLITITLPFEIYLMTIDYKIAASLLSENFNSDYILNLIIERFKTFSGFPVIEVFCYLTVVFLVIFRPLHLNPKLT
jgi:hypothetical protein